MKKHFKVLSTAALAAALSVPVMATSVSAQVEQPISEVVVEKDGVVSVVSYEDYAFAILEGNQEDYGKVVAVANQEGTYVDYDAISLAILDNEDDSKTGVDIFVEVAENPENHYELEEEAEILEVADLEDITVTVGEEVVLPETVTVTYDDESTEEVAVEWDESELDAEVAGSYELTGTIEGTDLTATVTVVVEEAEVVLEVESVSAIDETGVTVTFAELEEAIEGAEVTVVDPSGEEVAVTPVNLEIGDDTVTFDFETAYEELPLGTFTVNGVEFDTAAVDALEKIIAATDVVKLWDALQSDYITAEVVEDNIQLYFDEIADADLAEELNTLEDVNALITEVNKSAVSEEEEEAIVKAVVDASNNLQLLNALSAFERVNDEWITNYAGQAVAGTGKDLGELVRTTNYYGADQGATIETIQAAIDQTNLEQIFPVVAEAENSLDAAKVASAKALVNEYGADSADETEISPKEYALDILALEEALIAVTNASTNATFKAAIVNLDDLEDALVEKYGNTSARDITEYADSNTSPAFAEHINIETVLDANLRDYRTAVSDEKVEDKNTVAKVNAIILGVNQEFSKFVPQDEDVHRVTAQANNNTDGINFKLNAIQKDGEIQNGFSENIVDGNVEVTINGETEVVSVDSSAISSGTLDFKTTGTAQSFKLRTVGSVAEATIKFTTVNVGVETDHLVRVPVTVVGGDIDATKTLATLDFSNVEGTYAVGEDVEFSFTLVDSAENNLVTENGTYASTITIGNSVVTDEVYYQNITFEDGKATVSVPARVAGDDLNVTVTLSTTDHGNLNITASEAITIEAGEFSDFDLEQVQATDSIIITTATDGINTVEDMSNVIANVTAVKVEGEAPDTYETEVEVPNVNRDGTALLNFETDETAAGTAEFDTGLAEAGTYKVTVTIGEISKTITIEIAE